MPPPAHNLDGETLAQELIATALRRAFCWIKRTSGPQVVEFWREAPPEVAIDEVEEVETVETIDEATAKKRAADQAYCFA